MSANSAEHKKQSDQNTDTSVGGPDNPAAVNGLAGTMNSDALQ